MPLMQEEVEKLRKQMHDTSVTQENCAREVEQLRQEREEQETHIMRGEEQMDKLMREEQLKFDILKTEEKVLYQRNSELDGELERQDRQLKYKQRMWRRELDDCELQIDGLGAENIEKQLEIDEANEKLNEK